MPKIIADVITQKTKKKGGQNQGKVHIHAVSLQLEATGGRSER